MATNPKVEADPATQRLTDWLKQFSAGLDKSDSKAVAALFDSDGFWRDFVAFTWNHKAQQLAVSG